MSEQWFKNAIIYAVDISTFQDGDGDGIGDIRGLTSRLGYLAELGVNCLWILPFYPSPRRDNGYDVTNYLGVHPQFGSLDHFRELVEEAADRNIRIMIDLVVHHTSDRHPWFEAARSDRGSFYRDYYIWSDELPKIPTERSFFPEVESGVWRYDHISKSYYRHGFYHFQPDLNFANVRVQDEVFSIVDFWLALGVKAFRIDAANHILGRKGLPATEVVNPGEFWQKIRNYIVQRREDAVLMAEADMHMEDISKYVIGGKGIHMLLNFWINQTVMYALASGEAAPLIDTLGRLPDMPEGSAYVNFLRNLDEFNLDTDSTDLSPDQQKQLFHTFGPHENMQVYGRGIRRRLAPMLGGNLDRLKLAYTLLFAMPGVPLIIYGDEIGMGDNLKLPERDSVRVPMQWADDANAGFSAAHSSKILHRLVTDPQFNASAVNVMAQREDPESLLNHVKRLTRLRQEQPVIGSEKFETLATDQPSVVVFKYRNAGDHLITFHNLSDRPCRVTLKQAAQLKGFKCILEDQSYDKAPSGSVDLAGYGWRWFAA
jgi:maltose alpha-D-glucosyltransferase/alpha-amylase